MTITWRSNNASSHFQKHYVTFDQVSRIFTAPDKRIYHDPKLNDYNEERFITIGTVDKRVLFVAFVKHDDEITIISARRLTKRQQERFNLC